MFVSHPVSGYVAVAYFKNWIKGGLSPESDHAMDTVSAALQKAGLELRSLLGNAYKPYSDSDTPCRHRDTFP